MEKDNNLMKIKLITIIGIIIVAIVICVAVIILNIQNQKIKLDVSNTDFALKFLKLDNTKENKIYSPLSIKYALHMLNDGASGNTKSQIENIIGNTNYVKYDNIENILSLANTLYIRDTYSQNIKDEYKNGLANKYNAEINYDDFKSANNINQWIENKTFGQIKNMLDDRTVTNPDTKMLLINALAINMEWKEKFKDEESDKFYLDNGNSIYVTMMNQENKSDNISYYVDNNITVLSMDLEEYENQQLEFIAIMPENNLSNYIENFEIEDFEDILSNLKLASETKNGLKIYIPIFSFEYELDLKENLIDLGITDAFNYELANFSNISNSNMYINDALHKANIDFTTKGIKAAASTVMSTLTYASLESINNNPIVIKINKPFIYLIRDKNTDEIWFVGTLYEPSL